MEIQKKYKSWMSPKGTFSIQLYEATVGVWFISILVGIGTLNPLWYERWRRNLEHTQKTRSLQVTENTWLGLIFVHKCFGTRHAQSVLSGQERDQIVEGRGACFNCSQKFGSHHKYFLIVYQMKAKPSELKLCGPQKSSHIHPTICQANHPKWNVQQKTIHSTNITNH